MKIFIICSKAFYSEVKDIKEKLERDNFDGDILKESYKIS